MPPRRDNSRYVPLCRLLVAPSGYMRALEVQPDDEDIALLDDVQVSSRVHVDDHDGQKVRTGRTGDAACS